MRYLKFSMALATLFFFAGCNKYPDGPKFTLLTKKERMVGEWDLKETAHSDGTVTLDNSSATLQLNDDGNANGYYGNITVSGEWDFTNGKEKVKFTFGSLTYYYRIMRLKSRELWLKDETTGDVDKYENVD